MSISTPDRFTVPAPFWRVVAQFGVDPAHVLREARLPASLLGHKGTIDTAQYFALWRALEKLAAAPGMGLAFVAELDTSILPAPFLVPYYASDFRHGLACAARFRQLYSPQQLHVVEAGDECSISMEWPYAQEPEPLLLTDVVFAGIMELGRRGTGAPIVAKRVELAHAPQQGDAHARYYGGPVFFRFPRNVLVLHRADLDRPFRSQNTELLELLVPALESALEARLRQGSLREKIQAVLKRILPGGRPDLTTVARELGTSVRTLQRRITAEGVTFRDLLQSARRELARQLLRDPRTDMRDVAQRLGFEDANSFYRAFRHWEGMTPVQWRKSHKPDNQGH